MKTLKLTTWDEVDEFTSDGEVIDIGTWRWGTETTYRLEKDGVNYALMVRRQPEMGFADVNDLPMDAYEVVPKIVTKTEWVVAPGAIAATPQPPAVP